MPKEITHWFLAREVRRHLPPDSLFLPAVRTHEALFDIGAVAPDIPFYYLAGPGKDRIQRAAATLHEPGRHCLSLVLSFFDQLDPRHPDPESLALGAGCVCHIVADTVFHPLVYYFSGMDEVDDGATRRHRQFETALDLYCHHLGGPLMPTRLGRLRTGTGLSRSRLSTLLCRLYGLELPRNLGPVSYALSGHIRWQALFRNKTFYRLMARCCPGPARRDPGEFRALAYPSRHGTALPFFMSPFHYMDPETGTPRHDRIIDLVHQVEQGAQALLTRVSDRLARGKSTRPLMDSPDLPRIRPVPSTCRSWRRTGARHLFTELYRGYDP